MRLWFAEPIRRCYLEGVAEAVKHDPGMPASRELDQTAASFNTQVLAAINWQAYGAVQLAEGNPRAVTAPVRQAFAVWQPLGAPYLAARLRVLLARACIALGDADGARLELEAAREIFEALGAQPDIAEVDGIGTSLERERKGAADRHGLSGRELQVLRLIASGKTNKAIARELSLRLFLLGSE
jgi:Bacterial regulatory proteins, luxR family